MRIVTIGGYGYDECTFFEALARADVDTFVDVRQRRGLRGRKYAFLNSLRLQAALAEEGIRYVYLKELAPTTAIRDLQKQADAAKGLAKRERTVLSSAFVQAYKDQVLSAFDVDALREAVGADARAIALFCVERHPGACHRSVVAEFLESALATSVEHLMP